MPSFPDRLAAWLCLALTLFTGLTPMKGFVLCVEEDRCVSIELKATDAGCDSCGGHGDEDESNSGGVFSAPDDDCPCVDFAVPSTSEDQVAQLRNMVVESGPWCPPLVDIPVHHVAPAISAGRGPPSPIPLVAGSLTHIRTTVLLI